uniref:fructose-bisphosphate aldolase n=1 Tax=Chrysotila carterae TaxID=13221 RepID=A0A7S4BSX8_CHRCT
MAPCPVKSGVVFGDDLLALFKWAKDEGFAIPAVNCVSSSSVNAVLEGAAKSKNPVIIQVSQGGGAFYCGKGIKDDGYKATIAGSVSLAQHVRAVAPLYDIPVVIHSDHCAKKLLPWFDGMLAADKEYFEKNGEPLFSSHMLDLSEEVDEENIETCVKYFTEMAKMKIWLEMEIGITGGVEDGVDNSGVSKDKLYTSSEQVYAVYEALAPIAPYFSIAAAFGNVHGVYKPGNVKLRPELLGQHQEYAATKSGSPKPLYLVFHGGSGSTADDIKTAVSNGVVKMNIDTDTQWAYWEGLLKFYKSKEGYLQGQIGNPEGEDKPNKSFYDPRKWLRECEASMTKRVELAFQELGAFETLSKS